MLAASLLLAAAAGAPPPVSTPALPVAAPGPPGHWSITTGETVSPGNDALGFELGWPGIAFEYLHGLNDRTDAGGKLSLLYGVEGTSTSKAGFGIDVPVRLVVWRKDKLMLGAHVVPGIALYSGSGSTDFFVRFPVGGQFGIQATPELRIAIDADLSMGVQLPHSAFLEIGPQFGFSVEFAVDKNLLVGIDARFGPQFYSLSRDADFSFATSVTVGYRL